MNARAPQPPREAYRRAFSLIELLLVTAILLLAVGTAAPTLMRSFRGARLRASTRTLVMAHRQARALASLRQEPFALVLDSLRGRLELVAVRTDRSDPLQDPFDAPVDEEPPDARVEVEWVRWLADRIHIVSFESRAADREHEGIFWVRYEPGGRSDGFTLVLGDEQDRTVRLVADAVTGRIEVFDE